MGLGPRLQFTWAMGRDDTNERERPSRCGSVGSDDLHIPAMPNLAATCAADRPRRPVPTAVPFGALSRYIAVTDETSVCGEDFDSTVSQESVFHKPLAVSEVSAEYTYPFADARFRSSTPGALACRAGAPSIHRWRAGRTRATAEPEHRGTSAGRDGGSAR